MLEIAAMSAAAAEPTIATPMPMAATELAIAAPPACAFCVPASTFFCAAACLSPRNFLTAAAIPSPSLRQGAQKASASDTCASTTLVTTASQSLPSRS